MPTSGAYEFKLAASAKGGLIEDELAIKPGEWAWIDRTQLYEAGGVREENCRWLMIYACCPDCKQLMTLYRRRAATEPQGHSIDAQGNLHPSVGHSWRVAGVEQCGFHTMPTRLLGFIDLRGT